ncbi:prenyltransferase [Harryflintia acetispora]|uniref:prenyltransferase n=1 Tax=Harryflintia acetispora TaxID=1849041 RepID=UPI001896C860|nr:prenyltransferase [Harryflintia acetispora]
MSVSQQYLPDVQEILSHRHDGGADFWTTPDKRLIKGAPFSALESASYLLELGMDPGDPPLREVAGLILDAWQPDGRFKLYPTGAIYPCQTAHAAATLCRLGYADDPRLHITFRHLLDIQQPDGGWRCNKYSYGRGPETKYSNPFPTLVALDAFRQSETFRAEPALERAVGFLLWHWTYRKPAGPCHYGIGSLFLQVEYPFRGYNLFYYLYVLSFYACACSDPRFLEALRVLDGKLSDGQIIVERVVPKLGRLSFCRKDRPSGPATNRYREILRNMQGCASL